MALKCVAFGNRTCRNRNWLFLGCATLWPLACGSDDPSDRELFVDLDGSGLGLVDLVAVIDDFASYVLDWNHFSLE